MKLFNLSSTQLKEIKPKNITIAVYGLGKMGLPLAAVFADHGFRVIGVDVNSETVKKINSEINPIVGEEGLDKVLKKIVKNKKLTATTDGIFAAKNSDIKIIIIPIFLKEKNIPELSILKDVLKKIAKGMNKKDIVILESTAPPGTTMNVVAKTIENISGLKLNKDFGVAHCPERTSSGTALSDIIGRLDPKIVGGSNKNTTEIVKFVYEKINKKGVIPVADTKTAEMVKVSEGIYRDVNIAFANNLYLICRELGVDAAEVIKACNTDVYSNILQPGPGVGGHCIPVYPYFILNSVKNNKNFISLARKINDSMSTHSISLIKDVLKEKGKDIKTASVLILGLAYRSGVKETRKSPGVKIAKELQVYTKNVYVFDPIFNSEETEAMGFRYKKDFRGIDCIVITTNEGYLQNLDFKDVARQVYTKAIVDTQNIINLDRLRELGFSVRRIGYAS